MHQPRHTSFCILHSAFCVALAALCTASANASLPAGYTPLEYVETDGYGGGTVGPWVLLDYTPTSSSVVEVDFQFLGVSNNQFLFCSRGSQTTDRTFSLLFINGGGIRWDYNRTTAQYASGAGDMKRHLIRCSNQGLWLDGVKSSTINVSPANYTPANRMILFASYTCATTATPAATDNYAKLRLYSFKAWDSDGATLRVNLLPCIDDNNAVSLYDAVSGSTYHSGNAKPLIAGPHVSPGLLISGAPIECGEPDPAYGFHADPSASLSVSAPAVWTNDAGTVAATCTGWKLYDSYKNELDADTVHSFTYVHPSADAYRNIEWQWAREFRAAANAYAEDGTASVSSPWVAEGATATFTATPAAGRAFSCWMNGSSIVSRDNPYAPAVTEPMTLRAVFMNTVAHSWLYDTGAKTLTEQGVDAGDTAWVLNCTVSGKNITIASVKTTGTSPDLNFRTTIAASDGGSYAIVAIGGGAFKDKATFTSVSLPDTLTTIGATAFYNCTALTNVVLSSSLATFSQRTDGASSGAFQNCTALRTVTPFLPDSLTYLGWATFAGCTSLEGDLRLGCGGGPFTMATYGQTSTHFGSTKITSVTMGEGVTYIGSRDFIDCTALTNVVLSPFLTKIDQRTDGQGSGAFQGCTALRTVTPFLPDTLTYLGWATFNGCTSLEGDLRLGCGGGPFTMANYGAKASHFESTKITSATMGDGVTSIGSRAFLNCTALTNVVLSSYLTTFGQRTDGQQSGAFYGCTALRNVTPLLPDSLTTLGWGTFSGCTSLKGDLRLGCGANALTMSLYNSNGSYFQNTAIDSATLGTNAAAIPPYVFSGCSSLTGVVVEAESPSFGNYTFANAKAVREVVFKGFPTWTSSTFSGWTNYQSRFIVPGLNASWISFIADATKTTPWSQVEGTAAADAYYAGFGAEAAQPRGYTVASPAKQWIVTTAADAQSHTLQITGDPGEYGAPSPAYGEYDFTAEVAQGGVECAAPRYSVVGDELKECTGYTISTYDDENMDWINPESGAGTNVLFHPATSGTRQLKWSFSTAGYRMRIDKPDMVAVASSTPFFIADGFYAAGAQVTLTASSQSGVFRRWFGDVPSGQEGNASVTLTMDAAKSLTPYYENGWTYDSSAKTITDGYWTLRVTVSGTELTVTGVAVRGILPILDLAKPVDGGAYTIVATGPAAFRGDTILEELVLPDTFREFKQRTDGQSSGAFENCTSLRIVTPFLPDSVTYLGWATFSGCTRLEGDLRLGCGGGPFTMATYGKSSGHFALTKITSVTMGDGVTFIGSRDFFQCTALTNVVLSPYLTTIDQRTDGVESGAFMYCTALRRVTPFLPDTLTYLGWATFSGCTSLEGDLRLGCGGLPFTMATWGAISSHFTSTKITSVTMGDGVTFIGSKDFFECTALTNVVLSPFLKKIDQRVDGQQSGAFMYCSALRRVTPFLPDTLTSLGWATFAYCPNLEGDLRLGCGTNALTLATYGDGGAHFRATAIDSATIGANVATIPNNIFNGCLEMRDVYFHARPAVTSTAFSSIANYQTRFFVPRDNADWENYLSNASSVKPWADLADGVRDEYFSRFSGRKPVGLGLVAPYKNQWLSRWSPLDKRTMIILR